MTLLALQDARVIVLQYYAVTCITKLCMQALVVLFIKVYRINHCRYVLIFVPVEVFMNITDGNQLQMKHPCTHARTHVHIYYIQAH